MIDLIALGLGHIAAVIVTALFLLTPIIVVSLRRSSVSALVDQVAKSLHLDGWAAREPDEENGGFWAYAFSMIFLGVIVLLNGLFFFTGLGFDETMGGRTLLLVPGGQWDSAYLVGSKAAMLGAFLGSFCWAASYMYRRVAGYDVSPLVYFRVGARFVIAAFVALAVRHGVSLIDGNSSQIGVLVFLGFTFGFYPWWGIDFIVGWAGRKLAGSSARSVPTPGERKKIPVDAISGIMPMIKARLEDFEIDDAHCLATTAPLHLYVRTSYDLAQILDWIAQAQLLDQVGEAAAEKLRRHGISNILIYRHMCVEASEEMAEILNSLDGKAEKGLVYSAQACRRIGESLDLKPHFVRLVMLTRCLGKKMTVAGCDAVAEMVGTS